ncbi:MAG TPA: molybdate ABC transporter substrate-binding protein [Gammaproteobacteria bacterium]|nr:molybdate ABC transporter substrate-binding protein [Gammaproteobacteria bacterium]
MKHCKTWHGRTWHWLVALLLTCLTASVPARAEIEVWAAASLADVLDEAIAVWEAEGGEQVRANYAATSLLARQIAEGAKAEVFLSADGEWMRWLVDRGRVAGEPHAWAGNTLVLITPAAAPVTLATLNDLPQALGEGQRLAVADPSHVPAGRYAQAALESLGLWPALQNRLAPLENVRATLQVVAAGDLPLGIVYETDALAEPRVRQVASFPADSHPPIVYWVARVQGAEDAAAAAFLAFLLDRARMRPLFERFGFAPAPGDAELPPAP